MFTGYSPVCSELVRATDAAGLFAVDSAARVKSYEPDPDDELDAGAVALLRAAIAERSEAEQHLVEAVRAARASGMPWSAIGSFVGTTGEAARQRYGNKVA